MIIRNFCARLLAGIVACTFLGLSLGGASAQAVAYVPDEAIHTYAGEQLAASRINGAAVVIIRDGQVSSVRGFGQKSGPQTPFVLGSVSKSFTALAIMQLVDAGKIALDAPVTTYIPWFGLANSNDMKPVTVQMLLQQTSGISSDAGMLGLYDSKISLEDGVRKLKNEHLQTEPGKQFAYSNANYSTLGLVIERVSGMSYGAYMEQHVFEPLDMGHTFTTKAAAKKAGLIDGHTNWFGLKLTLDDEVAPYVVPEGYIMSSAEDMSHYMMALLHDGVYNNKRIISQESLKLMLMPGPNIEPGTLPHSTTYAMGWGVGESNGVPVISHDGDAQNYHANIALLPTTKSGVLVLVNENATFLGVGQTYEGIMQAFTDGQLPPVSNAFRTFYIVFNVIVVLTLAAMAFGLWRLRSARAAYRRYYTARGLQYTLLRSVGGDIAIAVLVYGVVFVGLGYAMQGSPLPLRLMMYGAPDLTIWVLGIIGYFLVRATLKTFLTIRLNR
jgi:CubicO group peptidase (beta-lactamase class C family)